MNGHMMNGAHIFDIGVIDSGTTFTYVPEKLFKIILDHFDWFCFLDTENHCKGRRIFNGNPNPGTICFHYDELKFELGPKDFFASYPILQFHVPQLEGRGTQTLDWYPSEYMFRTKASEYCLAIEKFTRANEILMGGTFMRQNNIIFDTEKEQLGFARASCSSDPNQIANSSGMELKEIAIGESGTVPVKSRVVGQRYVKDLD
jgi:hypothetical protein